MSFVYLPLHRLASASARSPDLHFLSDLQAYCVKARLGMGVAFASRDGGACGTVLRCTADPAHQQHEVGPSCEAMLESVVANAAMHACRVFATHAKC